MRLGLVERGNYIMTEYNDLTGYRLEVNDFGYNFSEIIEETGWRLKELWNVSYPEDIIRHRLHFSEERYFNRMVKNEHYGIFSRHIGAHVCLGLVNQAETYNLVIHEIAHEIHFRQGGYHRADDFVREACAIMAEEEYAIRSFDWNPHFTSQQLLHQLMELPNFGQQTFAARWETLSQLESVTELSWLINYYLDANEGGKLKKRLESQLANQNQVEQVQNSLAATTLEYALYNRKLLFAKLASLNLAPGDLPRLVQAIQRLKKLDALNPHEKLSVLMEQTFYGF